MSAARSPSNRAAPGRPTHRPTSRPPGSAPRLPEPPEACTALCPAQPPRPRGADHRGRTTPSPRPQPSAQRRGHGGSGPSLGSATARGLSRPRDPAPSPRRRAGESASASIAAALPGFLSAHARHSSSPSLPAPSIMAAVAPCLLRTHAPPGSAACAL